MIVHRLRIFLGLIHLLLSGMALATGCGTECLPTVPAASAVPLRLARFFSHDCFVSLFPSALVRTADVRVYRCSSVVNFLLRWSASAARWSPGSHRL